MGELNAKTNLEKMGFSDPDKKSSEHDEIQIWVYENIKQVISEACHLGNYKIKDAGCSWEFPIIHQSYNYKAIIGYADLMVFAELVLEGSEQKIYNKQILVEIKTKIPVLGELIRQLTTYRNYISNTAILLVCPDDKFEKILKEQGFYFFKYTPQ